MRVLRLRNAIVGGWCQLTLVYTRGRAQLLASPLNLNSLPFTCRQADPPSFSTLLVWVPARHKAIFIPQGTFSHDKKIIH